MQSGSEVVAYLRSNSAVPLFICGDSKRVLRSFPDACIDMCMTSPPYWSHRIYAGGGLGRETTIEQYMTGLFDVFTQVRRVLKPTGSFWLNLGDTSATLLSFRFVSDETPRTHPS